MRYCLLPLVMFSIFAVAACGPSRPATPLETFKIYINAVKAKDTDSMKVLLSKGTVTMHEQEAKAQGVTVDEIIKRETLFTEGQKTVEFRNEKIDGAKATLEVKNSYGSWEKVPFVREDGDWRIDKQGVMDLMLKQNEQDNRQLDDLINSGNTAMPTPNY